MIYIPLLLLSSLVFSSESWKPRYLSGLPLIQEDLVYFSNEKINVNYSLNYEDGLVKNNFNQNRINYLINISYNLSLSRMKKMNIEIFDCKKDLNVHIFKISIQSLNGSEMNSWKSVNGNYISTVHGFYDPTVDIYRNSIISFTPQLLNSDAIFVHEMAHYWYDRYCVYDFSNIKTETFARSVEGDYISIARNR